MNWHQLIDTERAKHKNRWFLGKPWNVVDQEGGQVWTVASNARVFVAVLGPTNGFDAAGEQEAKRLNLFLRGQIPVAGGKEYSLAALKLWAGQPSYPLVPTECKDCDGEGYHEDGQSCYECNSEGLVTQPHRPGFLLGIPVSRNLLAGSLECLGGDTVTIAATTTSHPVIIDSPSWRVAIMPMDLGGYQYDPDKYQAIKNDPFPPIKQEDAA